MPHAHNIPWIKGAPKLGFTNGENMLRFIENHISCKILKDDGELKELMQAL